MELKTTLNEEMTKRFEAVKESFGMNSNTSILNHLITKEYHRVQEATQRKVFVSKDVYDALTEKAKRLGKNPNEYVEEICLECMKQSEAQTAKA
jgi:uncharacterized protein (DUF2252 family)